jgi:hypothetical protein
VESSRLYYILRGFHRELVYCYLLDSTRIMCILFVHILLGGAFPKRHRANCGVIAIIRKVPILGRHKLVSEPRFCRYPRVRSACRITLPMVVVVSRVKTILLKMRWIALSRSAFYSLPMCFSPLTFPSFESSLLPTSSSLGSCVGGRSLAFILIGLFFRSSSSSMQARILCWWCREGTFC